MKMAIYSIQKNKQGSLKGNDDMLLKLEPTHQDCS